MSRCFIKFPIRGFRRTQHITSIGLFYKNVVILLGGCLTAQNQWGLVTGDDVNDIKIKNFLKVLIDIIYIKS